MDRSSELDLLGRFQLARLEHALAQRLRPAPEPYPGLADRCVLTLYEDCLLAGVGDDARRLIERYRVGQRRRYRRVES
jgi:hypothetical protein